MLMKHVLAVLSTCLIAGSFISAHADTVGKKHSKKSHRHQIAYKDEAIKPVIMKDEKPSDGLAWMDNLSGNLTLVSNYVFRGVTQSKNLPATQGGLTYTFPIGLYFNVWGSNVKFNDESNATSELDTIIGYTNSIGDDFKYDINADRYNYPGARELSYNEINTLFYYKFLQAGISYSSDVFATHKSGTYYQGGINYDIPANYVFNINDLNVKALFGHYNLPVDAGNTYNDYNVSLNKKLRNYVLTAQWTSTNGRQHNSPYDGSQLIGQVAVNF
jgi:uncharacterized protein (TIGR02001 family)